MADQQVAFEKGYLRGRSALAGGLTPDYLRGILAMMKRETWRDSADIAFERGVLCALLDYRAGTTWTW